MLAHLRPAVVMIGLFTLVTGLAYPLVVTGVANVALPFQAHGSLVENAGGQVIGSALLAQSFAQPKYLHPRGSSAGNGYDATASSASNLGPMDKKLIDRVAGDAAKLKAESPGQAIPPDAVTQSGSGLDPDVSPQNAALQAARIAKARGTTPASIQAVIDRLTQTPALGFIGQPTVNVLAVNRALDAKYPVGK